MDNELSQILMDIKERLTAVEIKLDNAVESLNKLDKLKSLIFLILFALAIGQPIDWKTITSALSSTVTAQSVVQSGG